MATRLARQQARQAKAQTRALARVARIQNRYGLIPDSPANLGLTTTPAGVIAGSVSIPSTALPPPAVSNPLTAVMDTAPIAVDTTAMLPPSTNVTPALGTDPFAQFNFMATSLPRVTKQQLRYERRQLKKMPKELRRISKLNELRAMQEFTLNQQTGAPPDLSLIRGGAQYMGPTQQGSAAQMFDPMAVGAPPGPGAPYPGSFGPPMNNFSPPQFQPGGGYPPGGLMLPPSQSGVPGGLIYTDMPSIEQQFQPTSPETDVNEGGIFEEEGEQFGASFADMEPLDSYGAVTGEPAQVGFFDKLGGLLTTAGGQYADIEKAKAAAKTAKYQSDFAKSRAVAPASSSSPGPRMDNQALFSMGLIALGGFLLLKMFRTT